MRNFVVLVAAACALLVLAPASFATQPKDNDTHVQLLAINDFHGNLEPNTPGTIRYCCEVDTNPAVNAPVVVTRPAGGVEYLATEIKSLRDRNSNTITVGAGDMIGASPLDLRAVPRRAGRRGAERDRPAGDRSRQPRVRRRDPRAVPDAVRRVRRI
jgi:2',3'-cyclic-nucleotide 2'-phosphodiesterase (5'-nucleotidase family)